jgi:uncharacterized membrane protein SpoIIM required for sporulation
MVLEAILNPEKAESKPSLMIFLGFLYTTVAMFLAYSIFKAYSSLFMIFLATLASIPLVYKLIKMEEQKDITDMEEKVLIKEHSKALRAFMYLFIGSTLAFALWYVLLPGGTVAVLFESQTDTLSNINPGTTYTNVKVTGYVANSYAVFGRIFFNNVKVLLFCVLFSFLYGSGAIFILLWNASVVGTAMGNFVRTNLAALANEVGGGALGHYLSIVSIGLFKYAIHGIPEILSYFIAALAGGIISIAVVNHDLATQKFEHILLDSADLLLLSLFVLFLAGVLEVWVTLWCLDKSRLDCFTSTLTFQVLSRRFLLSRPCR